MKQKTEQLAAYMKMRAAFEQVDWKLSTKFLEAHFRAGTRNFFGVKLDDAGRLISDAQRPEFFAAYEEELAG